jgi:hypothetical protein
MFKDAETKARKLVLNVVNNPLTGWVEETLFEETQVSWFSQTELSWRAIVLVNRIPGLLFIVTWDSEDNVANVDWFRRISKRSFPLGNPNQ